MRAVAAVVSCAWGLGFGALAHADKWSCFQSDSASSIDDYCVSASYLYDYSGSGSSANPGGCWKGTTRSEGDWNQGRYDSGYRKVILHAIHGGRIEAGTWEILNKLYQSAYNGTGHDLSYYYMHAHNQSATCYPSDSSALHITATAFNGRYMLELTALHQTVISLHGHGRSTSAICTGGLSSNMKSAFMSAWNSTSSASTWPAVDASASASCDGLEGTASNNSANKGTSGRGLQLEMSSPLRDQLAAAASTSVLWTHFKQAVQAAYNATP